ncbi:NUDIX hydrolase [Nonomuraea sp. SYSU D8015]|uniref:NUDIX hydrolase n=1 Tax=Nonomuraea sp. SYSU D8015 TaxID=2593644 RepID=UPI00166154BE|nr:NUDIX domain-containing protein [Nonomuraea sp. SYSU D8015]
MIPLRRFTARALPIDSQDRVLLLRGFDPESLERTPFWFTVGGAMEDGETPAEAAARELYEEAGIRVGAEEFSEPYATGTIEFTWGGYAFTQDEVFLAVRVGDAVVSFEHMEQIEKDTTTAYRWWSVEELEGTEEIIYPRDLATILRKVTEGGGGLA